MAHNKKFVLFILSVFVLLVPVLALAVRVDFSGTPPTGSEGGPPPFTGGKGSYLHWFFPIMLSAAGILAVLMIVIGGLQYVAASATGNPQNVGNARQRIIDAVFGLLLAFGAWLILYIINPNLVSFQLIVPEISQLTESGDDYKASWACINADGTYKSGYSNMTKSACDAACQSQGGDHCE